MTLLHVEEISSAYNEISLQVIMKAERRKHGEFYYFVKLFDLPVFVVAPDVEAEVLDEDD